MSDNNKSKDLDRDPDPDELRVRGRSKADELQARFRAEGGDDFAWFDALYKSAEGRRGYIPWSEAAPRFKLMEWLEARAPAGTTASGLRAVDVGCGLGDNAQCLARAGYCVTAFDISAHAVSWARENISDPRINFEVADIFDLPSHWQGGFDLVHETYNLQAMPNHVEPAARAIASLIAPGGTLLVMTRARLEGEDIQGPPRPLTEGQLEFFENAGLERVRFEEFFSAGERPIRHYLAEYVRSHVSDGL